MVGLIMVAVVVVLFIAGIVRLQRPLPRSWDNWARGSSPREPWMDMAEARAAEQQILSAGQDTGGNGR
jgi:hypothetical protein